MKRPPGLWILLSAGVLLLSLQEVYGIRATALIFSTTTTSTTTESSVIAEERSDDETAINTETTPTSNSTTNGNSTTSHLTGIPQIDYIWDPNLPQELKGYNLSEYPFYERVPETIEKEIDFKCDGLHDGFYASIPHKCQVYHHCLFGTRYDFLCANYTAFDQKTFICQFVSLVDCVNSKKFWHRNDALYEAASTTTTASSLRANIYTTAPPNGGEPVTPRRPAGGARRPYRPRRRRPQIEYYDDDYYDDEYYDERPRSTRGRKKPRPRPVYDDEDEEYEDERYESRRGSGRRRPYRKKNKDRRRPEYDDEEEIEDQFEDEDFVSANKRGKNEDKRKNPVQDYPEERNVKRQNGKRRPPSDNREQDDEYERKPPRKSSSNRRPINNDYDDELPQSDDSRNYEQRPRKKSNANKEDNLDERPIIKPTTGTIYDRPRVAPRINLPVPKNAADKFAFKPATNSKSAAPTKTSTTAEEEEYLDEEYEEPLPKRKKNRDRRPSVDNKRERAKPDDSRDSQSESRQRQKRPEVKEIIEKTTARPNFVSGRNRPSRPTYSTKKTPVSEEYYDEEYVDDEKVVEERRPALKFEKKSTTTTSTTTTTTPTPKKEKYEPVMRIIKRPFLPSRGGSPYSPRGLQPVGLRAIEPDEDNVREHSNTQNDGVNEKEEIDYEDTPNIDVSKEKSVGEPQENVQNSRRPQFKPSPVLIKVPVRQKYTPPSVETQELIESEPSRQQTYKTRDFVNSRTTSKPKVLEKNPLDLNEYDVTLNDALNPTLPNLPVRSFPTGFSSGNDYSYNTFPRQRFILDQGISQPNQNFIHPNKVVRSHQRYETVPQNQYSTINEGYRQPVQTQAIYSSY